MKNFLYRIANNLKKLTCTFLKFKRKNQYFSSKYYKKNLLLTKNIPEILSSSHNCALVALHFVLSDISEKKILEAFYNCCDKWPRGGVTHKEFNIVLRYLNIYEKFQYHDSNAKISNFQNINSPIILLIPGHFTTIYKNQIYDLSCYNLPPETHVYRAWELLST